MPDLANLLPDRFTRDGLGISLAINGELFKGWLQCDVSRTLESVCGTFTVPVTLVPGDPPNINRQDEVEVLVGETPVITGYVLSAEPFYRRNDCGIRVVGRDRTGDLVHSSAIYKGGHWVGAKLDRIVRDLLSPFGLGATFDADVGAPIADFKLSHGETVLDALARLARLRGVLVTRADDGQLLITRAGTQRFEGEIRRGWNVVSMEGIGTDEQRHSHYTAYGQTQLGLDFEAARSLKAEARDPTIFRYLPLVLNAYGNTSHAELQALVDHTLRVRRGHSMGFRYVVDGWTFNGKPWPLNKLVPIYDDIAGLDGQEWLITSVRFTCDLKEADVTELVVRPVESYSSTPLASKIKRRRWGSSRSDREDPRGPNDGARTR